jgi:hypothetical protein
VRLLRLAIVSELVDEAASGFSQSSPAVVVPTRHHDAGDPAMNACDVSSGSATKRAG